MRLGFCVACGFRGDELNHHHIVPTAEGGSDSDDNILTLCRKCHGLVHGVAWSNSWRERYTAGIVYDS
jgi:5-methylcytosine-specific restriction endonuclease McrA